MVKDSMVGMDIFCVLSITLADSVTSAPVALLIRHGLAVPALPVPGVNSQSVVLDAHPLNLVVFEENNTLR